MAGRGKAPKASETRKNPRSKPVHEWKPTEGSGWQHGKIPLAPRGLMPASSAAWRAWFRAWFAAHWGPEDLPGLRQLIRLYDEVERNEFHRHGELRIAMDTYGITPKGQQDRRWAPPAKEQEPTQGAGGPERETRYGRLRAVEAS